jgi:hypothetical protein
MLDDEMDEWEPTRECDDEQLTALRRRSAFDCEEVEAVEVDVDDLCDEDVIGVVLAEIYDDPEWATF